MPTAPSCWWMCSQMVPMPGPARVARASSVRVERGVQRRPVRVVDSVCQPRGERRCSRRSDPGGGGQEPHPGPVPLHLHALPDPPGRRTVVGRLDLDTASRGARSGRRGGSSETARSGSGPSARAFLGITSPRPAVWSCRGSGCRPSGFPSRSRYAWAPMSVSKREALERGLLGVADTGFDLALPIRVADTARQRDDPVVRQHVPVERISGSGRSMSGVSTPSRRLSWTTTRTVPPSRRNARS